MTSKIYSAVLAGTAVLTVALASTSAHAAQATGTARARVLSALTLTNNTDLNFGSIVATGTAGTVQISDLGGRTCSTPNVTCSGSVSAAAFTITTGTGDQWVSVDVADSVTLDDNGPNTMIADLRDDFTIQLDSLGTATFAIGGTLSVGANQAQGIYDGTFTVTANYQ